MERIQFAISFKWKVEENDGNNSNTLCVVLIMPFTDILRLTVEYQKIF